ncbi:MAG: leucine-rich repeat protein, partial [Oscillospiraceae bacterium]|nr:leucine-rich repeat protein [Oscillospiraceae bacterium]
MSDFIIKNGVLEKYTGNETKVVIPDSVKEIGEVAFLCQTTLKEIIIPSSVTKIGEHAFVCCVSL